MKKKINHKRHNNSKITAKFENIFLYIMLENVVLFYIIIISCSFILYISNCINEPSDCSRIFKTNLKN